MTLWPVAGWRGGHSLGCEHGGILFPAFGDGDAQDVKLVQSCHQHRAAEWVND